MKHIILLLFLFMISCRYEVVAPPNTDPGDPLQGPTPTPTEDLNQPKYFGYYASQMDGVAVTADIDELKDKSNFVFVHSSNLQEKFSKARAAGLKVMISLSWATFGSDLRLLPDWQQRLSNYLPIIDENQDIIIANYILDEPYMNARDHGVSINDMYNYLETLGQFFKNRYPQMPLAVIFAGSEIREGFIIPPSFDWFGMDCYNSFTWCERNSIPGHYQKIKNEISKLEAVDKRKRWLMAVPPAGFEQGQPEKETNHFDQINSFRDFIKNEPRMKIVIPFIWQTFGTPQTGGWTGARDSSKLKDPYIKMYHDFMNGTL